MLERREFAGPNAAGSLCAVRTRRMSMKPNYLRVKGHQNQFAA